MDILFVSKIQLLITFSRKIDFTDTIQFPKQIIRYIFKAFWSIYVFYLKFGIKIMVVHDDVKFAPVQELIVVMSSGLVFNLTSSN